MTEDNFKWTDELVMEIIGLTHRAGYHKEPAKVYDRVIQFKQSKLQSQDKQVGWEILELIFWSGEKTTDFLVIQNWLRGDKRYEKWSIYSVKRLSDGEVFTIGAKLEWGGGSISPKSRLQLMAGPIISFSIREDNMVYAEVSDKIFFPITHLHKAKPKPQPSSIDRIEVSTLVGKEKYADPRCTDFIYSFESNSIISPGNFPAIKQAIEAVLNGDTVVGINPCSVTGLFTNEQQDYVDSVRDCDLRAHLLHQVRLRDNMEADRNSFEKQLNETRIKHRAEVDTIRKESFEAAKKHEKFILKYPKYEDYLKSLSTPTTQPKEEDKPVEEIKLPLSQIKHLYEIWIKTLDKRPFMDFVYSRVIF